MNAEESPRSNTWLSQHAHSVTSQRGEDGILEALINHLPDTDSWCVEFGCWDGKYLSNTYNLIANKSYSGVLIEGSTERYKDLVANFKDNPKITPVNQFVGFDRHDGLDLILAKTNIPKNFDLLSIDIDGNDYHVWDAFKDYQPKIVIIEFNPSIPPGVSFVQPRDMTVTQGSSLHAMVELGRTKGYELVAVEAANCIFVDRPYFASLGIADNSIAALWNDDSLFTNLFVGFDGTIFLSGCSALPWQRIAIHEEDIQLIPAWARENFKKQNFIVRALARLYKRRLKRRRPAQGALRKVPHAD